MVKQIRRFRVGLVVGTAACMATVFIVAMTDPAFAQTSTRFTQTSMNALQMYKHAAAISASNPDCADGDGFIQGQNLFWRCTGTDPTSKWVGSSCNFGEYNAGTFYNAYITINDCSGQRVWLHEFYYPEDETSGWAYCVGGGDSAFAPPGDEHPENIMVSMNFNQCTP